MGPNIYSQGIWKTGSRLLYVYIYFGSNFVPAIVLVYNSMFLKYLISLYCLLEKDSSKRQYIYIPCTSRTHTYNNEPYTIMFVDGNIKDQDQSILCYSNGSCYLSLHDPVVRPILLEGSLPPSRAVHTLFRTGSKGNVVLGSFKWWYLTFAHSFSTIKLVNVLLFVPKVSIQKSPLLLRFPVAALQCNWAGSLPCECQKSDREQIFQACLEQKAAPQ